MDHAPDSPAGTAGPDSPAGTARTPWVTVLAGAGISTDSGIPDFRGPHGVWTRDPEAARLLEHGWYVADADVRRRTWRMWRASPVWQAQPTAAHRSLVDLERAGALRAICTQNFDGLHQRAGSSARTVLELHGSLSRWSSSTTSRRRTTGWPTRWTVARSRWPCPSWCASC